MALHKDISKKAIIEMVIKSCEMGFNTSKGHYYGFTKEQLEHQIGEILFICGLERDFPQQTGEGKSKEEIKRHDDIEYTYYQIDLENINEDWDYTICETLDQVRQVLQQLDIHLDDDTPLEEGMKRQVCIHGIGMTPIKYREWLKDNEMEGVPSPPPSDLPVRLEEELWDKAAMELFLAHNPNTQPTTPVGQRMLQGFKKDMEILKLFFTIQKK